MGGSEMTAVLPAPTRTTTVYVTVSDIIRDHPDLVVADNPAYAWDGAYDAGATNLELLDPDFVYDYQADLLAAGRQLMRPALFRAWLLRGRLMQVQPYDAMATRGGPLVDVQRYTVWDEAAGTVTKDQLLAHAGLTDFYDEYQRSTSDPDRFHPALDRD
jgi:hypothetical protein